ncbi:ABC transporter permease [Roseospira visakhapatnamensis]|uniref:Peptide/nickel transport system permease protein n=1 Tax=Roseospira visakhapatnamensis TaxID=390880 RepID=A0A7W6RGI2_9PROT|nr:ABC transporter permease [Roseospira visakhapatnamensis]MBB4268027.1 peptide/nickel transport system permease protein [Roseospira visakhapatnamensis]
METRSRGLAVAGAGLIIAAMIAGMVWGLAAPLPDVPMTATPLLPPGPDHWLGTNQLGQDNLLRALAATPGTLALGLAASLIALVLSTVYGFLAVTAPPILGRVMMRAVDVLLALPSLVVAMLVASYLRPGPGVLVLLMAGLGWPPDVRVVAALARREVARDSTRYARAFGGGQIYVMTRHVVPRMVPVLVALTVQGTRQTIAHASALAFVGLTDPSFPTWGGMLAEALPLLYTPNAVWQIAAPALALCGTILVLGLAGTRLETWAHRSLGGSDDRG